MRNFKIRPLTDSFAVTPYERMVVCVETASPWCDRCRLTVVPCYHFVMQHGLEILDYFAGQTITVECPTCVALLKKHGEAWMRQHDLGVDFPWSRDQPTIYPSE